MSSAPRPLAVVNPRASGGRAGRTVGQLRAILERRLGAVDLALTERPGHAIDLARDAALQGCSLVIAVGGDGTLHEVANGVLDAGGGTPVGYIGQGTGGDFGRTLGVEHRLDAYIEAIASGRQRRVDVGKIRYRSSDSNTRTRWFVNIVSVGMGGLVDALVAETTKVLGGKAAYFWASLRALARCRRGRLRCVVTLGGNSHELRFESFMIAICNGRYFGGGMHVAPMARADDGRFDVISLDAPNKVAFATASLRIYEGRHLHIPGVRHFACDRIAIDLEDESVRDVFLLDVDGEPLGGLPLEVELAAGALTLRM
jgi:diacylglycerol kinase (ATP)